MESAPKSRPDEQEFDLLPLTRTRAAIGQRTLESVTTQPQFILWNQVDCTKLVAAREAVKAAAPEVVPTYNDFIIKAVAGVLRDHPRFNAWWAEDGLHLLKRVNISFAVATDEGVLMPTILDADAKSVFDIAREARGMIGLARTRKLRASLQMGAGFSISNIGPVGIDGFNGIVSPPMAGILAVGSMKRRPVVCVETDPQTGAAVEAIVIRPTMNLTLTVDHRMADGADGAAFLAAITAALETLEPPAAL
jgi:pyruvate dehydrogenase E2 component (dihydrolipoamide acetyltransferase)